MNTTSTTLNVTHQYTPITPSNTTDLPSLTRAIYVGGAGNVAVVRFDGTVVTFSNVAAGSVLPVSARRVNSSGTTATGLCALFGRLERVPFWVPNSFSPLDLSPVLWLDASDTSTITESGGSVSQWDDKSGNGNNVVQATAANQPTTGTRTINSLNVLDFDGSSDHMKVTYGAPISQPLTIFAVAQNDDPPAANVLWAGITTLANAQLYLAGTVSAHWINGGDPTLAYNTAPDGNLNIYRVTYNGASTSFAINGNVKITGTTGTHSPTGFTIGASTVGSAPFDGVIGETIVVEGAMTAQQISDTETYLADKWGITL